MTVGHDRADSGFTLVELLIVVVIMGIVIGVICQTLILGLKLGPQTRSNADIAAKTALLTNALSDDLANASLVVATTSSKPCSRATPSITLATITVPAVTIGANAYSARTVTYKAVVAAFGTSPTANTVKVVRSVASVDEPMLTAYCTQGGDPFVVTFSDPTYALELSVRPRPTDPAQKMRFGGARRLP